MLRAIFASVLAFSLCGCITEYNIATQQEELIYYSTEKEERLGASVAAAIEKEYKLAEDPLVQERVRRIGERIAAVSDRKDIKYHFKVIDEDEVNAVSLPGGYVYCFSGLMEKIKTDDQLAAVLAHEVAHIAAKHSIKKLQAAMGYSLLRVALAQAGDANAAAGIDAAVNQAFLGYSREDELQADTLGVKYTRLAGYDPDAALDVLEILEKEGRKRPAGSKSYFRTHPYIPDRIRVVRQGLGEDMSFTDYINIEQEVK